MSAKPSLLVVGDFNREDYVLTFEACKRDYNFYFIEYISNKEVYNNFYQQFGKSVYWGEFSSAFDLLEKINPSKVVFFYVESFFHVALLLACKVKGIKTYHLEHGIRDVNINIRLAKELPITFETSKLKHVTNVLLQIKERVKGRFFLLKTQKLLPEKEATLFKVFFNLRKCNTYLNTIAKLKTELLWPDASISYSPKVFAVHASYLTLPSNYPVHYIGIPMYDYLAGKKESVTPHKYIIFIDQGLSNRNYFGWTQKEFKVLLQKLNQAAQAHGFKLLIKPHPSHLNFNQHYGPYLEGAEIIRSIELLLPETKAIIGFFSTLLLPLAAMPHTTLITLENHPVGRLDVSKSFIEARVAHPVYSLDDLPWALENIEKLHQEQLPNKKQFERDWLYKFDGKAGERLRAILLSKEL